MKIDTLIIESSRGYNTAKSSPFSRNTINNATFSSLTEYKNSKNCNNYYVNSHDDNHICDLENLILLLETNFEKDIKKDAGLLIKDNLHNVLLFPSSNLAAKFSIMSICNNGDHFLLPYNTSIDMCRFAKESTIKHGITFDYYSPKLETKNLASMLKINTKLILIENPNQKNIELITNIAKNHNILTLMNSQYSSLLHFKPLQWGIDISVAALEKYTGSASCLGSITAKGGVFQKIHKQYKSYGISIDHHCCYSILTGIKSMAARIKQHQESSLRVAKHLKTIKEVQYVIHPKLELATQPESWQKYFSYSSGLIAIILDQEYCEYKLNNMLDHIQVFGVGEAWGGDRSIIIPYNLNKIIELDAVKITGTCIKIFCGLENPDDMIEDIDRAFSRLRI